MVELMEFIFSSMWTYFGTLLLVSVAGMSIGTALSGVKRDDE